MRKTKRKNLESRGWRVGSADEFLELSCDESTIVDLKLLLADNVRKRRIKKRLTQSQVAHIIHSSQSRVAKMEAGDPGVSLDLLVRTFFALGATKRDLVRLLS